jgi:hypothetical protein
VISGIEETNLNNSSNGDGVTLGQLLGVLNTDILAIHGDDGHVCVPWGKLNH